MGQKSGADTNLTAVAPESSMTPLSSTNPSTHQSSVLESTCRVDSSALYFEKMNKSFEYPLVSEDQRERLAQARNLNMQGLTRHVASTGRAYGKDQRNNMWPYQLKGRYRQDD